MQLEELRPATERHAAYVVLIQELEKTVSPSLHVPGYTPSQCANCGDRLIPDLRRYTLASHEKKKHDVTGKEVNRRERKLIGEDTRYSSPVAIGR